MIDNLLRKAIRRLVTMYFKRTHFFAYTFEINEKTGISILSEEVHDDFTRHGLSEIPHPHKGGDEE